jgi:hypothetical protein
MQRFTFTSLQASALVSTLFTLNATYAPLDIRQQATGEIILTVYRSKMTDPSIYEISTDGHVRELPEIPETVR